MVDVLATDEQNNSDTVAKENQPPQGNKISKKNKKKNKSKDWEDESEGNNSS